MICSRCAQIIAQRVKLLKIVFIGHVYDIMKLEIIILGGAFMFKLKVFLKIGAVLLAFIFVIISLSFLRVWINDRRGLDKISGYTVTHAVYSDEKEELQINIPEEKPLENDVDIVEFDEIVKPDTPLDTGQMQEFMSDFCKKELEPLGLSLKKDEYHIEDGIIILYFLGGESADYEIKKNAAFKLCKFIYTVFEEETGFKTNYLKVHLKQPEGESFALSRDQYNKWYSQGMTEDMLFQILSNMITKTDATNDTGGKTGFSADALESYLRQAVGDDYGFKVEGEEKADAAIYIFINKSKDHIDKDTLEDLAVKLCSVVLRNDTNENTLKVSAFKLIDSNEEALYVFYRTDIEKFWPKNESDKKLREMIRNW